MISIRHARVDENIKRIPGYVYPTQRQCIWAELDIWLKEQKYCGYGNGTQVLIKNTKEQ